MHVSLKINISKIQMRDLGEAVLGPKARTELNMTMGEAVREKTREYLVDLAQSRHTTANRLGATPTGHLEQAWKAVENAPVEADPDQASFVINYPGLGRAFHDVTISGPKGQTIPVCAMAYGRRAGEFSLYKFTSKFTGSTFLALRQEDRHARPILMYLLVRSVTQKKDRSLLPSNAQWRAAAIHDGQEWVDRKGALFVRKN